jgi:hypothetical protein
MCRTRLQIISQENSLESFGHEAHSFCPRQLNRILCPGSKLVALQSRTFAVCRKIAFHNILEADLAKSVDDRIQGVRAKMYYRVNCMI